MHHVFFNGVDHFLNASVYVTLLSIRFGLALMPILQGVSMPTWAKSLLVISLALLGSTETRVIGINWIDAPDLIIHWALKELFAGFSLGMGVMLALHSISMAGSLLDVQIGFGMARIFDVTGNRSSPLLGAAFNLVGMLVFLLLDMHLMVLRALAQSLHVFPVGQDWMRPNFMEGVPHLIGTFFALGFALAAPLVLVIFLFDLFLAILARNLPQMNMLVFGFPLKIIVGLIFLSIWSGAMGGAIERIYSELLRHWFNSLVGAESFVTGVRAGQRLASVNMEESGYGRP